MDSTNHEKGGRTLFLFWSLSAIVVVLLRDVILIEAAPQAARVTSLPGFSGVFPSRHYSGYVTLDLNGKVSKNLFYYFVESERNPSKDPVVLWLNGGPGCSSFDGFVYEHGPFNFEAGVPRGSMPKLHLNPYSWSKVSNIIYLDSPTGVGFSYYTNATNNYKTGDLQTANDSHHFLLKWFELYPEYQSNVFYLSGESYAGAYVPTLAFEVVKGIKAKLSPVINFKGYMVGNGVIHNSNFSGENALVPFAHGMALISEDLFQRAKRSCNGEYTNNNISACNTAIDKIYTALSDLNIYNILKPCFHDPSSLKKVNTQPKNVTLPPSFMHLGETNRPLHVRTRMFGRAWPYRMREPEDGSGSPMLLWPELTAAMTASGNSVPCIDDIVASTWLNNDAVRKAIHASPKSGSWELCKSLQYYPDAGNLINYHKNLTLQGYRALIYSGDHDMCVPYTGTEAWTRSLGYKIIDEWRPWFSDDQVSGYTQGYANDLVFLTIKGSGHTVPEYKPREALDFYNRWLEGKPI